MTTIQALCRPRATSTPEPGSRALAEPAAPQAVAADRAWLAAMMDRRTAGDT